VQLCVVCSSLFLRQRSVGPGVPVSDKHIYRRVAELHIANINRGFLGTLGVRFMTLMYQAIDEGADSVLLVARDCDQVVGFVSGTSAMRSVYRRMLRHGPRLFVSLLPVMLSPLRMWRILEILRYSRARGQHSLSLPEAELLSIAVDEAHRRSGHAEALYQRLCEYFQAGGVPAFKIVVGEALEPAHHFYLRMGAQPVRHVEVHKGEKSTVYVHRLLAPRREST
jgi:ribosomal protein S18 acetylase RimI-like enzyme